MTSGAREQVVRAGVAENAADWTQALARLPVECRDVYFTREYHELQAANPLTPMHATAIQRQGAMLFVPGLKCSINATPGAQVWDLQTCNGYGGPLASADAGDDFLAEAWAAWRREVAAHGGVAGFFRLHPLLRNERWLPRDAVVQVDRATVYVDLTDGVSAAWARADSRHRNMISKGRRERVSVEWDHAGAWGDFAALYAEAMARLAAPAELRFSPDYFTRLQHLPGASLACVSMGGRLEAAACFLFGSRWAHYHLSARRPGAGNHLMNCILQSAFERAAAAGLHGVHLGGGRTNAPDDELLKFKMHTGGRPLMFKVARVVTDHAAFDALVADWRRRSGQEPRWLLAYRQPKPQMA